MFAFTRLSNYWNWGRSVLRRISPKEVTEMNFDLKFDYAEALKREKYAQVQIDDLRESAKKCQIIPKSLTNKQVNVRASRNVSEFNLISHILFHSALCFPTRVRWWYWQSNANVDEALWNQKESGTAIHETRYFESWDQEVPRQSILCELAADSIKSSRLLPRVNKLSL